MLASLIALGLVGLPAAESAAWVAQLRTQVTGVASVAATFTRTETDGRLGSRRVFDGELRLARRPDGGWVGDLQMTRAGSPDRLLYTLWDGKVHESDPARKVVTVYTPEDADPLRMAAEYFLPALYLLTEPPVRPVFAARLTGGQRFYQTHTLTLPAARGPLRSPGGAFFHTGDGPSRQCTVWAVAVDGYDIPRHLPRHVRCEDGIGPTTDFELKAVRLDAADGPTPGDIADPTELPAGWRRVSMAEVWENSRKAVEAHRRAVRSPTR